MEISKSRNLLISPPLAERLTAFAIESSGPYLSVAIAKKGRIVLKRLIDPRWNHEVIFWKKLPHWLKKANLKINDLNALATTKGPGRFTGVRLGLSICNSWSMTNQIPLFAPSVHEILEREHSNSNPNQTATLVAFSGSIVLRHNPKKLALKSFSSIEDLFKSKEFNLVTTLVFYAAENLHEIILKQCQKRQIKAVSTIPHAATLVNWILNDPPKKSLWHHPPRLAQALYLKESWK